MYLPTHFFLILLTLKSVHSTVLGIDFGTEYIKSSLISPGRSFLILEDTTSKRKTPSSLCFYQNKRFYEYDCASKRHRVPQSTFLSLRKYLSFTSKSQDEIQQYTKSNYEFLNITMNQTTQRFSLQFQNTLTFQEITSMVLKHVQQSAQRMINILPKDVVLTIPYEKDPSRNIHQRQAFSESCKLADLNLLGFIHENIAANLYLAVERLDQTPTNIIIINIGSGSMQVSISQMVKINVTEKKEVQTLRVLSQVEESQVSGYVLDQLIARMLAKKYDEKYNPTPSILQSTNTMIKLHKESEKIKEVLSANKEMSIYIENLHDGNDFHTTLTRSEFEDSFEYLHSIIITALNTALNNSNLTLSEIHQVELVGGVIRIPKIQSIIQEFLGEELEAGQHLNGDEAMACGAAFYAANMSQAFRVRQLQLFDGFDFSILLKISNNNSSFKKYLPLFEKKEQFGSRKGISFEFDENLLFELIVIGDDGKEVPFKQIVFSNITDILTNPQYEHLGKPQLYFQFILSDINIVELEIGEAELNEVQEITVSESLAERQERLKKLQKEKEEAEKESENNESIEEEVNQNNESQEDAEEQEIQKEEEKQEEVQKQEEQEEQNLKEEDKEEEQENKKEENENLSQKEEQQQETDNANTTNSSSQASNSTNNETVNTNSTNQTYTDWADYIKQMENELINKSDFLTKTKIINTTHYIPLSQLQLQQLYQPLNETEFNASISVIQSLDQLEELLKKNAESKNTLETLIYEISPYKDNEQFLSHSTEKEQQELFDLITEYDDWLYSTEASESNYTEFNSKHLDLFIPYKEILHRIENTEQRPEVIKANTKKLEEFINKTVSMNNTMPWVNQAEIFNLSALINETQDWFQNIIEEQRNTSLAQDPLFTKDDIEVKIKDIENEIKRIKRIKKPKNKTKKNKKVQETIDGIDLDEILKDYDFNDIMNELNESTDEDFLEAMEQLNESGDLLKESEELNQSKEEEENIVPEQQKEEELENNEEEIKKDL